jgi:hypothetical protein
MMTETALRGSVMVLPEIIHKKVERELAAFCERRIPAHVRDKLRLTFEFRADSVTLFEDRPLWNDPAQWTHSKVAQFRFDMKTLRWSLYCCDRNSKWHLYESAPATASFEGLLAEVDRDPTGIFWG